MAFAYFRWFPGDYARDTGHLTLLQHGAYRHLIDAYMGAGKPIRGDLNALCRICGALSGEERQAVEFVLGEFFVQDGPVWRNHRCDRELSYLSDLSTAGRHAAQSRWNAAGMRSHSDGNANQNQNQNQNKTKIKPTLSGSQANTDGARVLLEFLNRKAGRYFRPTPKTLEPIVARLKEGNSVSDCKAMIVHRWRDWESKPDMHRFMRPETLFGATKFAQYMGDVPPETEETADVPDQDLS